MISPVRLLFVIVSVLLLGGCASTGPHWGANAAYVPSLARVQRGIVRAVQDPHTWVPAVGAGIFAIGDLDENVSRWASRETPIFGSIQDADDWSARLRNINRALGPATILLTDSGTLRDGMLANKLRGTAVNTGAMAATAFTVETLKESVGRERPNRANDRSFPSDRAAQAAVGGAIGRANLDWVRMPARARDAAKAGFTVTTWLAAWARVEAQAHYPSDVLAGMALGNFFAKFAHETLLLHPCDCRVSCGPRADGMGVGLQVAFTR